MIEAILSLSGLGLIAGIGLGIASKVFHVYVDPKVEAVEGALLGTNCGACGFPGCSGLANAIIAGEAAITDCLPGGEDVVNDLCRIMGVEATAAEKEVAIVLCKAGDREAKTKFDYMGVKDCWAAMQVGGGFKSCSYGCLGLGSCYKACEYDAIEITEDRLAIIIPEKCTGCTMCVPACPVNIIKMVPASQKVHVLCSSFDKGPATKKVCSVGCIGCTLCTKKTSNMSMENNLAIVDYSVLDNTHDPVDICPTGTISDFEQAHPLKRFKPEKKKKAKKAKPAAKVKKEGVTAKPDSDKKVVPKPTEGQETPKSKVEKEKSGNEAEKPAKDNKEAVKPEGSEKVEGSVSEKKEEGTKDVS
ncbi:MAG: RnfABCDGE type electron transport complex subunit B [Deltaproteobacteria bacterium]|nr:RnfABCDGE type electron transport complex subunit B [Deltaproteobacteria bacterium]